MSKARDEIAVRHLRLITKLCRQYWHLLPDHVRAYLDLDDMIAETVMVVTARSAKYKRSQGAETTFVYHIAYSHICNTLVRHRQKKRVAQGFIPIDNWHGGAPAKGLKWLEAKSGIERVLQFASGNLREALSEFIEQRKFICLKDDLEELQRLLFRHRVSRDDFASVLKVL